MDLKYIVHSVDNTRDHYKKNIHAAAQDAGLTFIPTTSVDGRIREQLEAAQGRHDVDITDDGEFPKRGHLGIWYTVLDSLAHAPVVTFEDDAILSDTFEEDFNEVLSQLPDDADFFSLFIPRDSDHMCTADYLLGNQRVCRAYQRYGGVSMYFTAQGARKIHTLLQRDGIFNQYDDQLYWYAKGGELNGYTSTPMHKDLVYITGEEGSIVQETEYINER